MTQNAVHAAALALALVMGVASVRWAGVTEWSIPLVAAGWWVVLVGLQRALHALALRRRLRRDPEGPHAQQLADVAALRAVVSGGAGFTACQGRLAALERAVLLGPARGPLRPDERFRVEDAIRADIARMSPGSRDAIVAGLDRLIRAADEALTSPFHPLHPMASDILQLLGEGTGHLLDGLRAAARRSRRRELTSPSRPAEVMALRLLASGHDHAALEVIETHARSDFGRRLRRLARCRVLLIDAARGDAAPPGGARAVPLAVEMLLLAGRRMPDLVPGTSFLAAYPGGAAALERAVARTSVTASELAQLAHDAPELERPVATVLARVVGWPVGATVTALRRQTLCARPDEALRSHLRGLALLEERRTHEAIAEFEAALAQDPGFAQAAFSLATAKHAVGRSAAGEAVLRALVERRSRAPEPLLYLARFLSTIGERDRARESYEIGLGRFPNCTPLRVAFAQELLIWGDGEDALEHLEIARRHLPREPRLGLLTGRTLATEGRLEEAAAVLERAAQGLVGSDRAEAWFWLMAVRRDQGDHSTAQRIARRLVRTLQAEQWSLLEDVADYLEERHDYERAREANERVRRFRGE